MLGGNDDTNVTPLYDYYVETDLDSIDEQPIDYSKRYADQDSDEVCGSSGKKRHLSSHSDPTNLDPNKPDDELKVYCIEGTPLLISSASSLCDLREIGPLKQTFENDFVKEHKDKKPCYESPGMSNIEEGVCEKFIENPESDAIVPAEVHDDCKSTKEVEECKMYENFSKMSSPMMFSRSSSVGSLNSFEQHSFIDDRSSISAFSTLASGIVSPSELPDSPGMMSPFMHKSKQEFVFPPNSNDKSMDSVLAQIKVNETEVFEDEAFEDIPDDLVKVYNDEGDCHSVSNLSALSIPASSTGVSVAIFHHKDPYQTINLKSSITISHSIPSGNAVVEEDEGVKESALKNECIVTGDGCVDAYDNFAVFDSTLENLSSSLDEGNEDVLCSTLISGEDECEDNFQSRSSNAYKSNLTSPENDQTVTMPYNNHDESLNSSKEVSDDEYDALFEECIKNGMPSTNKPKLEDSEESLNTSENNQISASEDNSLENKFASEDEDESDDENDLLMKQCIQMGMPKQASSDHDLERKTSNSSDRTVTNATFLETTNSDDDEEDDELLNQCIKLGMPKSPYEEGTLIQTFSNYSPPVRTEKQEINKKDFATEPREQNKDAESSSLHREYIQVLRSRSDIQRNNTLNAQDAPHVTCSSNFQNLGYRDNIPDGTSDDDDDDILSQCIQAGMPVPKPMNVVPKQIVSPNRPPYVKSLSQKKLTAFEDRAMYLRKCYSDDLMQSQFSGSRLMRAACIPLVEADDSTCVYQTEDTPLLSPTPSLSDLSTLSFTEDKLYPDSYLNNSRNSDCSSESDDDELLLQCIRSGMPGEKRAFA